MRAIAKSLSRSVSTISDELKRNRVNQKYDPQKAHHKAYARRRNSKFQGKKIAMHDSLRTFVEEKLTDDLSPASISGRLKYQEKNLPFASKDSIYRFLKSPYGRTIEDGRRQKHKCRFRRRKKSGTLDNRTFIDQRPQAINRRTRIGDVEGDFIVSGKTGKGILLVVADRKIRIAFLKKIFPVSIKKVHNAFLLIKKRFPEMKTMTTDNDILFQHHKKLEKLLHIKIYFCHPYHSWEKGTVENTNKYIRKDIPKGSDISRYSKSFIQSIEQKLNRRPMKCLNYLTPQEARYHPKLKNHKIPSVRIEPVH